MDQAQYGRKIYKDIPWGWVVTGAAFFNTMFSVGTVPVLGVYFTDWQDEFSSSRTSISGVSSLCFSLICAATPIGAFIADRWSCRTAVCLGGLLLGIGYFLAFFCQTLLQLYMFIGLIGYLGGSFAYTVSYICVTEYMDKRLSIANSIANCGSPLGSILLPIIFDYIRFEMTWRNAVLVASAVYFNVCAMGMLMRPNRPRPILDGDEDVVVAFTPDFRRVDDELEMRKEALLRGPASTERRLEERIPAPIADEALKTHFRSLTNVKGLLAELSLEGEPGLKPPMRVRSATLFDDVGERLGIDRSRPGSALSLSARWRSLNKIRPAHSHVSIPPFCDGGGVALAEAGVREGGPSACVKGFWMEMLQHPFFGWYLAYSAISFSSIYTPSIFLVPYAVRVMEVPQWKASRLVSINASFILLGSLLTGVILSHDKMRRRETHFLCVAMALLGLVSVLLSLAPDFPTLAILAAIYGALYGVWGATYFTVMVGLFGQRMLPSVASVVQLFGSVAIFGGPPLAGILSTYFRWYGLVYVFAGAVILLSAACLSRVLVVEARMRRERAPPAVVVEEEA